MLSLVCPLKSGERSVAGIACIGEGDETREDVKVGPVPEAPGGSIQNPGVTEAGGEMLSDASVDHGSNDGGASGTSGSA